MTVQYTVYADGACKGNPGRGGWGAVIYHAGDDIELFGGAKVATNNQMELTAVIKALTHLQDGSTVKVFVDSQYVKNGIQTWIKGWKKNGWKTAAKQPVKNADLWKELDAAVSKHKVEWLWVRGHSGDPGNEHADLLANKGAASVI